MIEYKIQQMIRARKNNFMITRNEGPIRYIVYNRPQKANSFTIDMYSKLELFINEANKDHSVKFIVICGEGDNFSTGNDLTNFTDPQILELTPNDMARWMAKSLLQELIKSIITCTKPIFAIIQGRCTGFGFTQLALFDKVFAVDGARFRAPLVKLGQGPQMCSSYTFPKMLGNSLSNDILIQGKQVSVDDLAKKDFVVKTASIQQAYVKLREHINMLDQLDYSSLIETRNLIKYFQRGRLLQVNEIECRNLIQRWLNPDLVSIIAKYMAEQRANKKKQLKPKL